MPSTAACEVLCWSEVFSISSQPTARTHVVRSSLLRKFLALCRRHRVCTSRSWSQKRLSFLYGSPSLYSSCWEWYRAWNPYDSRSS